jgi:benzodiazapine receptor
MALPVKASNIIKTGAAVAATAVAGSLAARSDTLWYRTLRKPKFQPPAAAFPIVWTLLYADIAVASAHVIDKLEGSARRPEAQVYGAALGINLVLNASWTWVFFRAERPRLATLHSAVLAASSADLVRRAAAADPRAGAALAPYAAWTGFATVLAGRIAALNRKS